MNQNVITIKMDDDTLSKIEQCTAALKARKAEDDRQMRRVRMNMAINICTLALWLVTAVLLIMARR